MFEEYLERKQNILYAFQSITRERKKNVRPYQRKVSLSCSPHVVATNWKIILIKLFIIVIFYRQTFL